MTHGTRRKKIANNLGNFMNWNDSRGDRIVE